MLLLVPKSNVYDLVHHVYSSDDGDDDDNVEDDETSEEDEDDQSEAVDNDGDTNEAQEITVFKFIHN